MKPCTVLLDPYLNIQSSYFTKRLGHLVTDCLRFVVELLALEICESIISKLLKRIQEHYPHKNFRLPWNTTFCLGFVGLIVRSTFGELCSYVWVFFRRLFCVCGRFEVCSPVLFWCIRSGDWMPLIFIDSAWNISSEVPILCLLISDLVFWLFIFRICLFLDLSIRLLRDTFSDIFFWSKLSSFLWALLC